MYMSECTRELKLALKAYTHLHCILIKVQNFEHIKLP